MAWDGFYQFGDTEIINAARVRAYSEALGMYWVKDAGTGKNVEGLATLLGDSPYVDPAIDVAPWYDPDVPESATFAGLIPLEVNGIENSTRESTIFEFTHDGGNPGTLREATKPVVFSVALVGLTEASVEYGFRWLKRALRRRDCTPGSTVSCRGERLSYARHAPADDVSSNQWEQGYERHLNEVIVNRGPVINNKRTLPGCNGTIWMVSFTAVAGDPYEYGNAVPVLYQMISKLNAAQSPYWPGLTGAHGGTSYTYATCPTTITTPVYDPTYSPYTPPPQTPDLMPGGFVYPSGTQNRMYAEIPASVVPLWDEVRPLIVLEGGVNPHRMIRIRFYEQGTAVNTNCGDVGEYVVSYLPAGMTLVIDAAQEAVYVYQSNDVMRRADSLVYSWNARPINWFGLSCGDGYLMTVDSDDPLTDFDLSLSLVPRSA